MFSNYLHHYFYLFLAVWILAEILKSYQIINTLLFHILPHCLHAKREGYEQYYLYFI